MLVASLGPSVLVLIIQSVLESISPASVYLELRLSTGSKVKDISELWFWAVLIQEDAGDESISIQ